MSAASSSLDPPIQGLSPEVTGPATHSRSYKACSACRSRKVRCVVEGRSAGADCRQCQKDRTQCTFETKKRSYDTSSRVRKSQQKRTRTVLPPPSASPDNPIEPQEDFGVRSSADALLFLSDVAVRQQDTVSPTGLDHITRPDDSHPQAGYRTQSDSAICSAPGVQDAQSLLDSSASPWSSNHVQNQVSAFHCRLFWDNIVLPHEALAYVFFFFEKLYPFFPFVPDMYYLCATSSEPDLQVMRTLFEDDEILLASIITVSSRYYHLPAHAIGGYERSCDIHSRCWDWTRTHISRVVFEGSRPKALLSIVESLLMLAEWMPKPIHALVEQTDQRQHGSASQETQSRRFIGEHILQPAFRTDHVSWSYVGNAFLLLRSLPPDKRNCHVLKTTNRYLVILFSCLIMSQSLARRLARPPLMSFDDVDMTEISHAFGERNQRLARGGMDPQVTRELSLGTSDKFHEAFVELMRLLARAQEVLHSPTADSIIEARRQTRIGSPQLIALLQHFDNLNQSWKTRYTELFDSNHHFEYLRLYEFSPSLGACVRDGRDGVANLSSRPPSTQQRADWEFSPESPAYYLEQAIEAAEALLRLLLNFHFPATQRTLRYASSRHYMKIVLRSGIPSSDYQTILVSTLKETVLTLESCSIDVAHPAFRYSILLRGLMAETQRRQESLTPSPLSLTIGPRDCYRYPVLVAHHRNPNATVVA
ncbi:hypothetical protein B0T10DRAFT_533876 [Thelonectria olida]|uniref:Zn(2)-C6 fungal-type domain-containing protein n=1 Tax=Thelonectria olida TaxID=1576542 RepID=A0A9P8VPY4_9HYPO|nr:hypothetical protein B0T10DRAFT_533876 [Thelonectria olida]